MLKTILSQFAVLAVAPAAHAEPRCEMSRRSATTQPAVQRVVALRPELEPVVRTAPPAYKIEWMNRRNVDPSWLLPQEGEPGSETVLAHYTNGLINDTSYSGTLLDAVMQAYNNHRDLTLVPDDVWMTILFQFAKHVNANADTLRAQFVDFQGKQKLTVVTGNELSENKWDEFFELILRAIHDNTKDGVVDHLQCAFSTTGLVERVMSTATIMDTFKSYFQYGRMIPMCGIRHVRFAGTLDDWLSIKTKLLALGGDKYKWQAYVDALVPVLDQLVATYQGNPDLAFWDKIFNAERGALGSGSTTYISGWILAFYGQAGKRLDVQEIGHQYTLSVPVEVENRLTGQNKTVYIRGTFGGLVVSDDGAYRPQMTMIVCELSN